MDPPSPKSPFVWWDSNHQFIWVVYDTALGTLPKLAGACRLYICLRNAYAYFM